MKHDLSIVKRAVAGDVEAFEQLLFLEEEILYYKALSYVGRKEDALDAIQETACNAFLAIGKLRQPEYFSTWLIRILIRECCKLLRKRNEIIPFEEQALLQKLEAGQDEEVECFQLQEVLARLSPSYQTAIILFYYHDCSIQEIAEIMQKPEGTVKTYLRRGRKKIKTDLEGSLG